MTNTDREAWLDMNMAEDIKTTVTSSFSWVPFIRKSTSNEEGTEFDRIKLFKECSIGDDSVCTKWFGASATSKSACCWQAELIEVPTEYNETEQQTSAENNLKVYKDNALPNKQGDVARYCLNNWILMYPDGKVPYENDFTWTSLSTGLTWKGYCVGSAAL